MIEGQELLADPFAMTSEEVAQTRINTYMEVLFTLPSRNAQEVLRAMEFASSAVGGICCPRSGVFYIHKTWAHSVPSINRFVPAPLLSAPLAFLDP